MKQKKVPLRTCVVTKEKLPKKELVRVVKGTDGQIFVDNTRKANGRGAYVKKDSNVIKKARKQGQLEKHLEVSIPPEIYDGLEVIVNE